MAETSDAESENLNHNVLQQGNWINQKYSLVYDSLSAIFAFKIAKL
jgi:hypothetical protein